MLLQKPAFPVQFSVTDAESKVSAILQKNNWKEYYFGQSSILYVPYYFFLYDIYEYKETTRLVESGSSTLNAYRGNLNHKVGLIDTEDIVASNEIATEQNFKVLDIRISEKEAAYLIPRKIASEKRTNFENVIITGQKMYYVPLWIITLTIQDKTKISIRIDGFTGEVLNGHLIPKREKGFSELTQEAMSELADPREWLAYSKELLSDISKSAPVIKTNAKSGNFPAFSFDQDFQILILAAIAIAVILWVVYLN